MVEKVFRDGKLVGTVLTQEEYLALTADEMRAATSDDIRSICRDPDGDLFMCEDCDRSDEKYYFVEEDEVAEFEKLLKAGHTSRYAYFYRSGEYPPGEHPYYREEDDDELVRPL